MAWLSANLPSFLIGTGLVLLAIEVAVLSFSVFILFFIGLACIVSGALMWAGLLPSTVISAFGAVAVLSLLFAVVLWKPLKKMQETPAAGAVKGDFIGHRFVLEQAVSLTVLGRHRLSGVEWKVKGESAIPAGVEVEVAKVEVGMLTVRTVV